MLSLYIVFDQLPQKKDGGLVATYINFVNQFKDKFDIKIVSVFANSGNDIEAFEDIEIINLSDYVIDNRFFRAFSYLKEKEFCCFFHALASAFRFFTFIPLARSKTKRLFKNSMVIVVSPAAAIFVSNKVRFVLEIHTKFEYFWGDSLIGKMQAELATKPALTLFRNRTDAEKARKLFPADHIYNGVPEPPKNGRSCSKRKPYSALYVGGLVEHKNPFLLIRCAQKVHQMFPAFTLDIYGVGDLADALQQEIDRLDLNEVIHLRGFIDDKSIYSRYEQFWFSSKLEGFGLVIVEAMANKTPVITTNWGDAVFEIVEDGRTGFVVNNEAEFCERSAHLFTDEALRTNVTEHAYTDYQARFSIQQNEETWERILASTYPDLWQSNEASNEAVEADKGAT